MFLTPFLHVFRHLRVHFVVDDVILIELESPAINLQLLIRAGLRRAHHLIPETR